ncbi:protocadherin gamma-C5-like [Octopus sinensis]|uniref:Protocadherin gamma-C5-like n=1 Tax=Octopus sinensis TaxID=2607531 RepID=A0A6P7TVX2_9MOLL|nr:protocadherin gamma-C5-like [Octopus sinensis]
MPPKWVNIFIFCHWYCIGDIFLEIEEESKPGTIVGKMEKLDSENINFVKLTQDMDSSFFNVDRETGLISTCSVIKRESLLRCRQQIDCLVTFKIVSFAKNILKVDKIIINILDVNNNRPTFYPASIFIELTENTESITKKELPTPYDYDSPKNGIKSCFIDSSINWATLSVKNEVNTNWTLSLLIENKKMNSFRESIEVQCMDGGTVPLIGTLYVEIVKKPAIKCFKPYFDYKILKISVSLINSKWIFVTKLKMLTSQENSSYQSPNSLFSIRYSLNKNETNFTIEETSGSVYVLRQSLLNIDNPLRLNVSACCQDLCDYCTLFIEPKILPKMLPNRNISNYFGSKFHFLVTNVREDGHLHVPYNSMKGTKIAYIVVESEIQGNIKCSSENPDFLMIHPLIQNTFALITGVDFNSNHRSNKIQCVTINCNIENITNQTKQVCIAMSNFSDKNGKLMPENGQKYYKKVEFSLSRIYLLVTATLLSMMFTIFAIYMILRWKRSHSAQTRKSLNTINGTKKVYVNITIL